MLLFIKEYNSLQIFASTAWSSSTWGIISGCAIFLLTYTERDIAQ